MPTVVVWIVQTLGRALLYTSVAVSVRSAVYEGNGNVPLGYACAEIGDATCEKLGACEYNTDGCEDLFYSWCCEQDDTCSDDSNSVERAVHACTRAILALPCENIGAYPPACRSIGAEQSAWQWTKRRWDEW